MIWLWVALASIVLLIAINIGVRRYGERPDPQVGWQPTDEVFKDPSTDRLMRVWVDPKDGSRHYVPEGGGSIA